MSVNGTRTFLRVTMVLCVAVLGRISAGADDAAQPITPTRDVIKLFNGTDLSGLVTWLGDTKYEDPRHVFTVEDGVLHISGDGVGYIRTEEAYRDYHLVIEFRWGERTWQHRQQCARDSGVIVHCVGPDGAFRNAFMVGFEAQMIEGGTGDIIVVPDTRPDVTPIPVSLCAETATDRDGESVWKRGGEKKSFAEGRINWSGRDEDWADTRGFRGQQDVESPVGEWTRMDVICDGGRITILVNDVVVNEGFDASHCAGQILLQTELAEVFVRRWELRPIHRGQVKVAAVQMLGYDKTDVPRQDFDPAEKVVRYVERAASDGAQLVVFPEYLLGRIAVPGRETQRIAEAAAAHHIYVIVGCWEVHQDGTFANTALLFDRAGQIAGKYHKVHAAVDQYEGSPPWSRPPQGKDADWFVRNDPEWAMRRGEDFPVFELDFGRIGILTCYDGWFPETFRILSLKGAELLVWVNGRRGSIEDFIVKSGMFQDEVAIVATNQAYGSGTMIGQWPAHILAHCPDAKEDYITATINLQQVRQARQNSRNAQQRRPALYGEIVKPQSEAR